MGLDTLTKHCWEIRILLILAENLFHKNPEIAKITSSTLQKFVKQISKNLTEITRFSQEDTSTVLNLLAKGIDYKLPAVKKASRSTFLFVRKNWSKVCQSTAESFEEGLKLHLDEKLVEMV